MKKLLEAVYKDVIAHIDRILQVEQEEITPQKKMNRIIDDLYSDLKV